ncbi:SHOCT domain-containing protein [Streptosporangium sp. NPDC000239]|uniref:SHOCT domain-containing protein n=1 Tax=Streptosporangium jomthongense TaxID=1193683 RepID=A0ABV8EUZ8_9ACTN
MMWGYGIGSWLVMGITTILLWVLIIAGIVALLHYVSGGRRTGWLAAGGRVPPEEVLAERLARGEVDAEEYRQRLEVLRNRR